MMTKTNNKWIPVINAAPYDRLIGIAVDAIFESIIEVRPEINDEQVLAEITDIMISLNQRLDLGQ